MSVDFLSLAHDKIKTLTPYKPGGSIEALKKNIGCDDIIKLASNENPLGCSTQVIQSLSDLSRLSLHRYPDAEGQSLKAALAEAHALSVDKITLGNGSESLISLLVQVFNRPDRHILIPQYSFIAYQIAAEAHHANWKEIPNPNYQIDIEAIKKNTNKDTSIIFLANPNNPTGCYLSHDALSSLLESIPKQTLLVADEAYYDYAAQIEDYPDSLSLLHKHSNLIILRTFSKAYGLAGLRVGYALSAADVADGLNRARLPFAVSSLSQFAAVCALNDYEYIQRSLELNQQGRQFYKQSFAELGLSVLPSVGNFITVNLQRDCQGIYDEMLARGIMLRTLHPYKMPNFLRITIGTDEQNHRVIDAFKELLRR